MHNNKLKVQENVIFENFRTLNTPFANIHIYLENYILRR